VRVHSVEQPLSDEEHVDVFDAVDTNGDGVISMKEFRLFLRGPQRPRRGKAVRVRRPLRPFRRPS
jgi:Ca2+-binding EF-hand superfamily protein